MEEERTEIIEEECAESVEEAQPQKRYTPRPAYQVWAARIGLVIVIIGVILYYYNIATGGR